MAEASGMFKCAGCARQYKWKPELAGKKVKCKCGTAIEVPSQMPTASGAPTPPPTPTPISSSSPKPLDAAKTDHESSDLAAAAPLVDTLRLFIVAFVLAMLGSILLYKNRRSVAIWSFTLSDAAMIGGAVLIWLRSAHPKAKLLSIIAIVCYAVALVSNQMRPSNTQLYLTIFRPIGLVTFFIGLLAAIADLNVEALTKRAKELLWIVSGYTISAVLLLIVLVVAQRAAKPSALYDTLHLVFGIVTLVLGIYALIRAFEMVKAIRKDDINVQDEEDN